MQKGDHCKLLADLIKHGPLVHESGFLCVLNHKRFGHLHYGAIPLLKDMVQGMSDFKIEKTRMCKQCALQKHAKTTFPSNEHGSRETLDLIHSDV